MPESPIRARVLGRWPLITAIGLAIVVVALGRTGSFVAGGADSYGYLSEARLWLDGQLRVRQDVMQAAPFPAAQAIFTPLGYEGSRDPFHIVPVHAPGLPLLMAAGVLVVGWCGAFWVVPLMGGLLIVATYAMGARLGRPVVGLAAAVLVAASPAVLFMLVNPMSDLPAAAALATAIACVLGRGRASALSAGLWVGLAILIRPNLVPVAVPFGLFTLRRDLSARPRRLVTGTTPWLFAGASVGIGIVAAVNAHLYGSPFTSGYHDLDYDIAHVWPNVGRYLGWLLDTQGPLVFVGLAALALPTRALWITGAAREAVWFFVVFVAAVVVPFLFFSINEAWWYLRYLLPMWPVMMLATAAALGALFGRGLPGRVVAVGLLVWAVWFGSSAAVERGVFGIRALEQKYIDAADLVAGHTDGRAAILAVQHSGSVRHYAGLMTLRWDMFERGTLDAALDWLAATGRRPWLLVEPWEAELFRRRYGATDAAGQLDWAPRVTLEAVTTIHLYDLADRRTRPEDTIVVDRRGEPAGHQCVAPAPPVPFNW
ncbi:MAG TPA: hypothetical protein VMM93_07825 [Vicinamibacterales bacterium]|nr:hypothetical protein [Vicinamibacterales bacterium]